MPVQINYMYGTYVPVPSSERKVQHYDLVEHRPLNPVISANKITRTPIVKKRLGSESNRPSMLEVDGDGIVPSMLEVDGDGGRGGRGL